jgi:hypothetical protein
MPDVSCTIAGARHLFELGEIVDEELADQIGVSQRTQTDGEGGVMAEEDPLLRMIRKKARGTYQTGGVGVDLVLHYDKQCPFAPADCLAGHEADIAKALRPQGPFSRVWVYDGWDNKILWRSQV